MVQREFLPTRACRGDLIHRLQVNWFITANSASQITGVGDHRNSRKIQTVDDSHGLDWLLLK